jgi:hypothetical protein
MPMIEDNYLNCFRRSHDIVAGSLCLWRQLQPCDLPAAAPLSYEQLQVGPGAARTALSIDSEPSRKRSRTDHAYPHAGRMRQLPLQVDIAGARQ